MSDSDEHAAGGAGADSETDDPLSSLPPAMTIADVIRHYSDEGKKLLLASLSSPLAAPPTASAPAARLKAVSLRELETELDDVKSVFGEKAVGTLANRGDGSVEFQLRLR